MNYEIRDKEHAESILKAYGNCSNCNECQLNTVEGWKCSYMAEQALKYLKKRRKN